MVGVGFRCWLAGCDTADIECWETGWNYLERELGHARAKPVAAELTVWVRTICAETCRKLEYYPMGSTGFCQDERTAISLIAACQHNACPALKACAFVLIGADDVDNVIEASESFAKVLRDVNVNLKQGSILNATALIDKNACPVAH
ncbi:MAG: hypothetical protein JKY94_00235 [Rhodobacteraceae bacterium]|nr:hypothetical protein [Paracoccaceae bacterium]